ncbi:MAG: type II secretion system protein GspK [Candidatus Omnitrophota bacterium]|nr:type II secretion system protein GspK [Candidatus Omnitrophota bacterium]
MIVLTVMVSAVLFLIRSETLDLGGQTDDYKLLALADAGVARAYRALRDDYLTTTQTGTADLRGDDTALSVSITNPANMRYIDTSTATINSNFDQAILRAFDANYVNAKIIRVELHARASRASGGIRTTMQVAYTVDGTTYTTKIARALTTIIVDYSSNITADRTWTWAILMSPNFRVRVMRMSTALNRNINLDSMYLRVTYSIDTLTEPWASGSYAAFPITLGGGTIQSVSITDESSKVHLNYASQALLTNLLTNLGVSSAATKAANIVTYRGAALTNPFDLVEELQQVTGITAADYTAINDYVTVYSFISSSSYRPPAYPSTLPRAPVNINIASQPVLKSIFDSSGLGAGDANTLANSIITQRTASPFVGFYSSASALNTYFYNFVQNLSSGTFSATEKNNICDTADPSALIPVFGATAFGCPTTELCYAGTAFYINSLGSIGTRSLRVMTMRNSAGGSTFGTYAGDAASVGWRKENFE